MEISKINTQLDQAKYAGSTKKEEKNSFCQLLNEVVRSRETTQPDPLVSQKIATPQFDKHDVLCHDIKQSRAIDESFAFLDILTQYGAALDDPNMSLKGMEPLVTAMEEKLGAFITQDGSDIVCKDEALSKIVNDIAVTAQVEVLKFRRGDYV
ncbi:MAG: hypothetical protein V1753_08505 [Pseudomonadota bacterium]